jgi:hypothetical protein
MFFVLSIPKFGIQAVLLAARDKPANFACPCWDGPREYIIRTQDTAMNSTSLPPIDLAIGMIAVFFLV